MSLGKHAPILHTGKESFHKDGKTLPNELLSFGE